MPARINKIRHDAYVYRIYDLAGTVYVGKGTGRRLNQQKRNFGLCGEIICYCKSELEAYEKEREYIAKYKPCLNKHPGGNGSWRGVSKPKWLRDIEAMGTRVYAARMLLRFDLRNYLTLDQIQNLRQIAAPSLVIRG